MKFKERALVKVYLEVSDMASLTHRANSQSRAVAEYVRRLILEDLHGEAAKQDLPRPEPVRVDRRRPEPVELDAVATEGPIGKVTIERTCQHGTAKGYHCWQCGGIARVTE